MKANMPVEGTIWYQSITDFESQVKTLRTDVFYRHFKTNDEIYSFSSDGYFMDKDIHEVLHKLLTSLGFVRKLAFETHPLLARKFCYINPATDAFVDFETTGDDMYFSSLCFIENELQPLKSFCEQNLLTKKEGGLYTVFSSSEGLSLSLIGELNTELEPANYTDAALASYDHIVKEFNSANPMGRLAILSGDPGTGKTYMTRALLSKITNCLPVLLPAKLLPELDGPAFLNLFTSQRDNYDIVSRTMNKKPLLFVVEDADTFLVPREDNPDVLTISSLLNFTDGILGASLDFRIICTTNASHLKFDRALVRPGRLSRHILIGLLEPEHANRVYMRLMKSDTFLEKYTEKVSLAQVYADVYGEFVPNQLEEKAPMGFAS
jgi:hypothetical protein